MRGSNKRLLHATPAHENDIIFISSQKGWEVLLDDLPVCDFYGQSQKTPPIDFWADQKWSQTLPSQVVVNA